MSLNTCVLHPILPSEILTQTEKKTLVRSKSTCPKPIFSDKKQKKRLLDSSSLDPYLTVSAVSKYLFDLVVLPKESEYFSFFDMPEEYYIFDELKNPINNINEKVDFQTIFDFVSKILITGDLKVTSLIFGVQYVRLLLKLNQSLFFIPRTWKNIVFGCFILGCKIDEDLAVYLTDFRDENFFYFKLESITKLEATICKLVGFNFPSSLKEYTETLLKLDFVGLN